MVVDVNGERIIKVKFYALKVSTRYDYSDTNFNKSNTRAARGNKYIKRSEIAWKKVLTLKFKKLSMAYYNC